MNFKPGMYSSSRKLSVTIPPAVKITVLLFSSAACLFMMFFMLAGPCSRRHLHKLLPAENVPVIVTGGNSTEYQQSKDFLMDLYKYQEDRYWGLQVVYIDLGLTEDQLRDLMGVCFACECIVREIPELTAILKTFEVESGFVGSLVMKALLDEYPFVMWFDSSTRLNNSRLFTDLFEKAIKNGLQIAVGNNYVDDEFGLTADDFRLLGENPVYYTKSRSLDTSWMVVAALDPKLDFVFRSYLRCVERSLCIRHSLGEFCHTDDALYSVKQCQAILAVRFIKEFDHCYRSFAFSLERYVLMDNPTCKISSAVGF
ncbi:uncharacterized protein [Argopecten irradians]|uniref:uncharacterized protein n=1 Tax=Argopecten irradians TaxID=31199 RepID=UPI003722F5CA